MDKAKYVDEHLELQFYERWQSLERYEITKAALFFGAAFLFQ
jgi:hypothetical protein